MTKYLMIFATLMVMACEGNDTKADPIQYTEDGWAIYAALEWSPLSENGMKWQATTDYCEAMGARPPTINELRNIIINCPQMEYGGTCKVSDPDCLSSDCRISEDCQCDGSADSYSAFGDMSWIWSSSSNASYTDRNWIVDFRNGYLWDNNNRDYGKIIEARVRCVR